MDRALLSVASDDLFIVSVVIDGFERIVRHGAYIMRDHLPSKFIAVSMKPQNVPLCLLSWVYPSRSQLSDSYPQAACGVRGEWASAFIDSRVPAFRITGGLSVACRKIAPENAECGSLLAPLMRLALSSWV